MVQTIQLIIEIPPVAVLVPIVQLQGSQVQFVMVDVAVFMQRQVPAVLCAGWASGSFIDISDERVRGCILLQFCSMFRPPSIWTLRPRVAGTPGV